MSIAHHPVINEAEARKAARRALASSLDTRALRAGAIAALLTAAAIYFGLGKLRHFDPALIAYTSATVFAIFGIV